jgi:hypothetical protein
MDIAWMIKKTGSNKDGKPYLDFLAETDNDEIFAIPIIDTMITYIWKIYFYRIRNLIFFPYMCYMLFFIFYATYITEHYKRKEEEEHFYSFKIADYILIAIILILYLYHLVLEIMQIIYSKAAYF